ncbi:hypothetical protein EJ04DRAFT_528905 [Polyplosphaeria fusca]|uniref:Uncharacterized protein n=1 Tax=Polyplosphaeria fusca TaxID=682080 RepID=A0A9P4QLZ0_9PLEO|nr:hypothetical protein EJ04DRAFT_528905 [Polyplosphaeria fusca]
MSRCSRRPYFVTSNIAPCGPHRRTVQIYAASTEGCVSVQQADLASYCAHCPMSESDGHLFIVLDLSCAWQSPGSPCTTPCSISGSDPANWTDLHGLTALKRCNEPVLFDTALWADVEDAHAGITLRSCTASNQNTAVRPDYSRAPFMFGKRFDGAAMVRVAAGNDSSATRGQWVSECADFWQRDGSGHSFLERQWHHDRRGHGDKNRGAQKPPGQSERLRSDHPHVSRLVSQARAARSPASWLVEAYADFQGKISATQQVFRT